MLNRRAFLMASCAMLLPRSLCAVGQPPITLIAGNATAYIKDKQISMLGYNGQTPGPTLVVTEGERVQVLLNNQLSQTATAIHWHGIRIDNAMDGVPGLTQAPVLSGDTFLYDFVAPDSGTYWYHSHHLSLIQVAHGLYGPLIVKEKNPPVVDHDIIVMIDDWRLTKDHILDPDFDTMFDVFFNGRIGNVAQAIFRGQDTHIKKGDRVRFRIINTAIDRIFNMKISGIDGKVVALDGVPVPKPYAFGTLQIAPAQRYDIICDVTADSIKFISRRNRRNWHLGTLKTVGERIPTTAPIPILPAHTHKQKPNLNTAIEVVMDMDGGNMGRELDTMAWSFNGHSGMDIKRPLFRVKRGQSVIMRIKNHTAFHHAIHTHGHHFYRLKDGKITTHRDTILVLGDTNRDIIMRCDNPGKWMLHCHMLTHSHNGMMTWFEVL